MRNIILNLTIAAGVLLGVTSTVSAKNVPEIDSVAVSQKKKSGFVSRLKIGGYGEVAYSRNFFQ